MKRHSARRPGLTRERIAAAAVKLIDRVGLTSFGVRRLAAELGVDPMSIYNHIPGKAALLDSVTECVLREAAESATDLPHDWAEIARRLARRYRDMAMRHPCVFPLMARRPQGSTVALEALETLSAAMRRAGFSDQLVADAPLALFGFLNGYLLAVLGTSIGDTAGEQDAMATPVVFDPAVHPTMASLAQLQADFGSREHFDRMLEIILTGLGTLGGGRQRRSRPRRKRNPR